MEYEGWLDTISNDVKRFIMHMYETQVMLVSLYAIRQLIGSISERIGEFISWNIMYTGNLHYFV